MHRKKSKPSADHDTASWKLEDAINQTIINFNQSISLMSPSTPMNRIKQEVRLPQASLKYKENLGRPDL